jgi:hypothetical protein
MSMTDVQGPIILPSNLTISAHQSLLIDAADEQASYVFRVPSGTSGSITGFGFVTNTVTTGATVDCRLETVSTSDGNPTGTLWGTNTNGSKVINSTDDNTTLEVTLTSPATVAEGDLMAATIVNPAVSPGSINIARINSVINSQSSYSSLYTGTWNKQANTSGCFYLIDSDGLRICPAGAVSASSTSASNISSSSTPDEFGLYFKLPFKCRVKGAYVAMTPTAGVTFDLKLYDASDTVLTSEPFDTDQLSSNVLNVSNLEFSTPYVTEANTYYRLTIVNATTTNLVTRYYNFLGTDQHSAMPLGLDFIWTERTDGGAWTDRDTRRPVWGLLIDQVDDGTGSGGGSTYIYNILE